MNLTLPRPHLPALLPLALAAALLALPAVADARAAKDPAPKLTIDERICNTGTGTPGDDAEAEQAERYATVTATAVLRSTADRVGLRFTMQQKNAKRRWSSVTDIDGTLGAWELSQSGRDGLRFTKTIDGLSEGTSYRVLVQARGVDAAGRATTATARRYVPCTQPQITPHVAFVKVLAGDDPEAQELVPDIPLGPSTLVYSIRNFGRSTSEPVVITATHATTGELYGEVGLSGRPPRKTSTGFMTMPTCKGRFRLTVRETDEDPTTLRPDQIATFPCPPQAKTARR